MAEKGTIRLKWVRSGIGFTRRQREMIRGLGLRHVNQVVERADTPRVRALVARVPHFVEIVDGAPARAWVSVPEYVVRPAPQPVPESPETEAPEAEPPAAATEVQLATVAETAETEKVTEPTSSDEPEGRAGL